MNDQTPPPENLGPTAEELFAAVKTGFQALGVLLEKHRDQLRRILRWALDEQLKGRADASDIIQDANLDVLEHLMRETGGSFAVGQEEDLAKWYIRIALNALRKRRRDEQRDKRDARRDRPWAEDFNPAGTDPTPSSMFVRRERDEVMERAINRLEEIGRVLIRLRYWHKWTGPQLAELVEGQATEAARMRMHRRMGELEFRLSEDGEVQQLGQ